MTTAFHFVSVIKLSERSSSCNWQQHRIKKEWLSFIAEKRCKVQAASFIFTLVPQNQIGSFSGQRQHMCELSYKQIYAAIKPFMVAYFCPLHASYFSRDYFNMQDTYVNIQDKYVNMQDNYVNMQDKNKMQLIYVNMQDIYVNMPDTYVNMQDNYVNMRDNYVNMRDNYVDMQDNYVNMQDNYVNMQLTKSHVDINILHVDKISCMLT